MNLTMNLTTSSGLPSRLESLWRQYEGSISIASYTHNPQLKARMYADAKRIQSEIDAIYQQEYSHEKHS